MVFSGETGPNPDHRDAYRTALSAINRARFQGTKLFCRLISLSACYHGGFIFECPPEDSLSRNPHAFTIRFFLHCPNNGAGCWFMGNHSTTYCALWTGFSRLTARRPLHRRLIQPMLRNSRGRQPISRRTDMPVTQGRWRACACDSCATWQLCAT
jgi:hypothetical protein